MSYSPTLGSYHNFQASLGEFIFFSPLTLGNNSGRAVKISKNLFFPFFLAVDPDTHDGQVIIRQIENLRTTKSLSLDTSNQLQTSPHAGQRDKFKASTEFRLVVKEVEIYYRVSQEQGDKSPSIYITQVRSRNRDATARPGLYVLKAGIGNIKQIQKREKRSLGGTKVLINGASQDLDGAMKNALRVTGDTSAQLFYSPESNNFAMLQAQNSNYGKSTIAELAAVITDNESPNSPISWYVEGEGAAVLAEALKQVKTTLHKQEFRFINPIGNTAKLLQTLTDKKATLTNNVLSYEQNAGALQSLSSQRDQLQEAAQKMPQITRGYILKFIEDLLPKGGGLTHRDQMNQPNQTFVHVLKKAGIYRQ